MESLVARWEPDCFTSNRKGHWDLYRKPSSGAGAEELLYANDDDTAPLSWSPDGRWVAYVSAESGRSEIYVAPFPGPGGKRLVSVAGGTYPRWRAEGKDLFYVALDNLRLLTAAEVDTKGVDVKIAAVRPLFGLGPLQTGAGFQYDVSADGQRFLAIIAGEQAAAEPLTLVQNWTAALKHE